MKNKELFRCLLVLSCFYITSCDEKINRDIEGIWAIDSLSVEKRDALHCLTINSIYFEKKLVETPSNICDTITVLSNQKEIVPYEILNKNNDYYLIFDKNSIFYDDSFKIVFFKDNDKKLLRTRLKSEDVTIVMSKILFNFDRNIDRVNELIKLTE